MRRNKITHSHADKEEQNPQLEDFNQYDETISDDWDRMSIWCEKQWHLVCLKLFEPKPSAGLAVFRIMWGLVISYEAIAHLHDDGRKIRDLFTSANSQAPFKYWMFEWVPCPSLENLFILFYTMLFSGLCVTIGFLYQLSSFIFFFSFSWMFLIEASSYLNHFYLITILSFVMIFIPANCKFSLDSLLFPTVKSETIPAWTIYLLRFEIVLVYFYAGVAKINVDWLRGEPLRNWLWSRRDLPMIGPWVNTEFMIYFLSYGGLIFDLVVGFMLLFDKTFLVALISSIFFHISNKILFNIGLFPWLMAALTTLFFDGAWPSRLPRKLVQLKRRIFDRLVDSSLEINVESQRASTSDDDDDLVVGRQKRKSLRTFTQRERIVIYCLVLFCLYNILMPLRHFTYPGDVAWNEYGHRWSWRMKLRDKECTASFFQIEKSTGRNLSLNVLSFMSVPQYHRMLLRPDSIAQFAHYAAAWLKSGTGSDHEIHARVLCDLNGRGMRLYVDPRYDITSQGMWDWPYDWVVEIGDLDPKLYDQFLWNLIWRKLFGVNLTSPPLPPDPNS